MPTAVATPWPNGPVVIPPADQVNYSLGIQYDTPEEANSGIPLTVRYSGTFTIDVRAPADNNGTFVVLSAAEAIILSYTRGSSVQYYSGSTGGLYPSLTLYPSLSLVPVANNPATVVVRFKTPTLRHVGNKEPQWYTVRISSPFWADLAA